MKISIEYESTWRNSFLDGSNNEPLPKNGRKFVGSMTNLKIEENFKKRNITIDTVMGILNRLIGDQRKLYQSRHSKDYFFQNIEDRVSFIDFPLITSEITYIRNMTGSTDQNAFTGAIRSDDKIFSADYSKVFWGVLTLNIENLCHFIIDEKYQLNSDIEFDPVSAITMLELLNKKKPVSNEGTANKAVDVLAQKFGDASSYQNKKGELIPISLYCSALYVQLERLSKEFDMDSAKTKAGGISGISKRGFTKKDFMDRFTTGEKKKIWGNPYIQEVFVKGEGKRKSLMTKASGQLEINIDVDRDKAKEVKSLIENAGVSSFYLGKKGLAYVTDIDTREVRH